MTPTSPLRGMAVARRVVGVAAVVAFGVWLAGPRPGGQAGVNHADGPAVLYELSFPEPEHRWMQVEVTAGGLTYTHDGSDTTSDTFTYTVSDGIGGTATGTVTLTIAAAVNNAPVAVDDAGDARRIGPR